jgi:hypothetical protein
MPEPVVRISQGFFEAQLVSEVESKLQEGKKSLEPAIRALNGLLHYYVSIDGTTGSMVNVSVWTSMYHARQMESLKEMLSQRDVFVTLGVKFQPIRNYSGLWSIEKS